MTNHTPDTAFTSNKLLLSSGHTPGTPENFFYFFKHNLRRKHTVASTSKNSVASTSRGSGTAGPGLGDGSSNSNNL